MGDNKVKSVRKTNEQFVSEVYSIVGDNYIFLEPYINNKTKILCQHTVCGYKWYVRPDNFLSYGSRCPHCRDRYRTTSLHRYGVDNIFRLDEIKQKIKETNIKKYGVPYVIHTAESLSKSHSPEAILKARNTCKQNGSYGHSKPEEYIYNTLKHYYDVKRQYSSDKYPYPCDFYIPSLDLYIEYQGWFGHGSEPYIGSKSQLETVAVWKNKNTDCYNRAIDTWVVRDPHKRKVAKENKLNFIEFFTLEEFNKWFDNEVVKIGVERSI